MIPCNWILHSQGTHPDWIGGETEALEGFSWRGGSERDTTGILMWSKPYVKVLPSGEEVCSSYFITVRPPSYNGSPQDLRNLATH